MSQDITGRDEHIILKALAYAINTIATLPRERREQSDRKDMKLLLAAATSRGMERHVMRNARRHMGLEALFDDMNVEAASMRRLWETQQRRRLRIVANMGPGQRTLPRCGDDLLDDEPPEDFALHRTDSYDKPESTAGSASVEFHPIDLDEVRRRIQSLRERHKL